MKIIAKKITISSLAQPLVVSFTIASGGALIIRGRNGIGKSTLLKSLVGLLPFASGTCTKIKTSQCHYLAHENAMKDALTVGENLKFYLATKKVEKIKLVLAKLKMEKLFSIPFNYLSVGQKRQIALARLLLVEKKIWILDEPFAGLDEIAKKKFTKIMQQHLQTGGIIILAVHQNITLANSQTLNLESSKFNLGKLKFNLEKLHG